jgi:AbrB family looped-hinge helix DNA binding protein
MSDSTTIMDKKGKITVPAKIRKEQNFKEGTEFAFLRTPDGLVLVPLLTRDELLKSKIDKIQLKKVVEENEREELELEER